jgi:hypothetical protein
MLRIIQPSEISFEWERVREGLIKLKPTTADDWMPEDIYMSIRQGQAALYVGEDEQGEYQGFLIMQVIPMFHGAKLHVWCAYSAAKQPLMRTYFSQLQDIARQVKAKKITFSSNREEWEIVSRRIGFRPAQMTYEFDL